MLIVASCHLLEEQQPYLRPQGCQTRFTNLGLASTTAGFGSVMLNRFQDISKTSGKHGYFSTESIRLETKKTEMPSPIICSSPHCFMTTAMRAMRSAACWPGQTDAVRRLEENREMVVNIIIPVTYCNHIQYQIILEITYFSHGISTW